MTIQNSVLPAVTAKVTGVLLVGQKICLFMADFAGGGAERVMVILANGFAARGYDVDLVVARASGPYHKLVSKEVRVLGLGARLLSCLLPFAAYIRSEKPTCVLAAGEHACVISLFAGLLSWRHPRIVLTLHTNIRTPIGHRRGLKERTNTLLLQALFRFSDCIVAVSDDLRREAIQLIGGDKSKYLTAYNPIFSHELTVLAAESPRHAWLEGNSVPVIITVGRLVKEKAFDTLLRAFSLLVKHVEAKLIILGEGPERRRLETISCELGVQDRVDFVGFVVNPYAYLSRARVFVLSSRWEGFGNVLVEAMAVGTPIVATNCPFGPREILEEGRWGTLVPVDDPQALSEAIRATLDSKAHRSDLKQRARFFSIDRALNLYEQALGLHHGKGIV